MKKILISVFLTLAVSCGDDSQTPEFVGEDSSNASLALESSLRGYQGLDEDWPVTSQLFFETASLAALQSINPTAIPTIAILDSNIEFGDEAFSERIWQSPSDMETYCQGDGYGCDTSGYSLGDDSFGFKLPMNARDSFPSCDLFDRACFHGTTVAGIAAGFDPERGIFGVCPFCKILPIKVVNDDGVVTDDAIVGALRYMNNLNRQGANIRVANASFGKFLSSEMVAINIRDLPHLKDTLMVAAAGNENTSLPSYPAGWDNVIAVASTDLFSGLKSDFSNFGTWVDISAPSGLGEQFGLVSSPIDLIGTSYSSPVVAGVAALVLSQEPTLSGKQLRERLLQSADGNTLYNDNPDYLLVDDGQTFPLLGSGIVNAENAVKNLAGEQISKPDNRITPVCGSIGANVPLGSFGFLLLIPIVLFLGGSHEILFIGLCLIDRSDFNRRARGL